MLKMLMKDDMRLIEDSFPIKEVSAESSREKGIRHGHISTFHVWWARRPLASSRTTIFSSLVPTTFERDRLKQTRFLAELSKWENSDSSIVEKAREAILAASNGVKPMVLDPFSGGGSIPLEALRLGCKTYASDYNPVAVLLLKCTLEYPQRYSRPLGRLIPGNSIVSVEENQLIADIKKWSKWMYEETKSEIGKFYPPDPDGSIPIAYIWARTVPCQNPSCEVEIPLMGQFWLGKKGSRKVSLYPFLDHGKIEFKIVGSGYEKIPDDFNPGNGTVHKAIVKCPSCGFIIDSNTLRSLFLQRKTNQRLIAVVLREKGLRGKKYRIANETDKAIYQSAKSLLIEKRAFLSKEWGIDPVPDESTPSGKGRGAERAFSVRNYGMNRWGDLFNSRQKLALITLLVKVRQAYDQISKQYADREYAKAITSYLALEVDMVAAFNNQLARWENTSGAIKQLFARQALPMLWDYAEANLFSGSSGSMNVSLGYHLKVIEHCSHVSSVPAIVNQSSATQLQYPDEYFDAVFTDPPYYDNVPYSYLSDFFYVWLKRSLGHLYPELFSTPLTPKSKEIVAYANVEGGWEGGKRFFEAMLKKSFIEINRVLKPNGIAVIVYAHKSTAGWETLINSLLDSGLVITAAWPVHTESSSRLRATESAALSSSIYIVARKLKKTEIGIYKDVKEELQNFLFKKMDLLWKEGISGADFLVSAMGSSVVVFGKYSQVIRENEVIRADVMLEDVRRIVTDYAVKQVLHNGFAAEISNLTRFYLLWRWSYGASVLPFDDARKLAQSTLVDLPHEWSKPSNFIKKQKEFVRLLGPQERDLEEIATLDKKDLIDVLHMALLLWQKGDHQGIINILTETGFGNKDSFYRVAQAISETLPRESQEKKLLEGFLAGKDRLSSETKKVGIQTRLFE
jgi:adenine-specific DNA methylase